jgi:segregation and condensation protein B
MDRDESPLCGAGEAGLCEMLTDEVSSSPSSPASTKPLPSNSALPSELEPRPRLVLEPAGDEEPAPLQIVEALLFAADAPLTAAKLAELAGVGSARQVEELVDELNAKYELAGQSFQVECIARGFQLMTRSAFQPWLARLDKHRAQSRLSSAALEALAIVAYKQPIIRADVEAIRGVACGEVLSRLREMGLVKIVGRAEIVGRPILYGTTKKFLDAFGLADLEDLPPMDSLQLRRGLQPTAPEASAAAPTESAPPIAAAGA